MAEEKATEPKKAEAKAAPKPAAKAGDDNIIAAACYIIGILVPLFVLFTEKKENKFLAYHAWQSLMLSAVLIVVWVGLGILVGVLAFATAGFGGILGCLYLPLLLVTAAVVLMPAYKGYLGEMYKLPVIGDLAEKESMK